MQPGDTFTTTIDGGPDAEAIYWGTTNDGHWLITWASRHLEPFTSDEGPKASSEPFTIAADFDGMLVDGARWIARQSETRRGIIIATGTDRYRARDERYNGARVMAEQYARRVQELADWRAAQ